MKITVGLGMPGAAGMGLDINTAQRHVKSVELTNPRLTNRLSGKYVVLVSVSGKTTPSNETNTRGEHKVSILIVYLSLHAPLCVYAQCLFLCGFL